MLVFLSSPWLSSELTPIHYLANMTYSFKQFSTFIIKFLSLDHSWTQGRKLLYATEIDTSSAFSKNNVTQMKVLPCKVMTKKKQNNPKSTKKKNLKTNPHTGKVFTIQKGSELLYVVNLYGA